jgi:hypothetical protein
MSLVVLASAPTPSRTALYDAMAEAAAAVGRRFHVLYCVKREQGANEAHDSATIRHAHTVLRGFHPSLTGMQAHLNPGVLAELNLLKPDTLILAGPWQTPTILLAGLNIYSPPPRRFYFVDDQSSPGARLPRWISWLRRQAYRRYTGYIAKEGQHEDVAREFASLAGQNCRLPDSDNTFALARAIISQLYPSLP